MPSHSQLDGIYEGFEENIIKFKTILDNVHNHQLFMLGYERWYNYSFIYYNRTGQFIKAGGFIEREKTTMSSSADEFSMKAKIMLWYFTAYNNYVMKDLRAALKMIQKIMNTTNEEMEEFSFAKLLLLFIHYDLNNYELLEYQVRSYQRLMQKSDRLYRCEKILLDFFKTVSGADTKIIRQHQLEALKKEVTKLFKTYYEKGLSFYFDLECWIESQLSGKDFAQVIAHDKKALSKDFKG